MSTQTEDEIDELIVKPPQEFTDDFEPKDFICPPPPYEEPTPKYRKERHDKGQPNITDVDCAEDTDIIAELARAEIDCGLATQPKTTHTNTMSRLTQRIPEGQLIFFLYR